MKILKIVLGILVALIVIIIVGSFFLPKTSKVERSVIIGTSDTAAYNYVIDFNQFNQWSPWYEMEPTAKIEITGNTGEIGSMYAWDGKDVGVGSFRLVKLEPYKAVYQKLTFLKPFEATATNDFTFENRNDSTKVTWIYEGKNNGIIQKWMGLCMDGMMGKDFDHGLNKMKANLEK